MGRQRGRQQEQPRTVEPDPQAVDAEEDMLAGLLTAGALGAEVSARVIDRVRAAGLEPTDFYFETRHGLIYQACLALVERDQPCDFRLVHAELERLAAPKETLDVVTVLARVGQPVANVAHYARLIRDAAERKAHHRAGQLLIHKSQNGGVTDETRRQIEAMLEPRVTRDGGFWLKQGSDLLASGDPGDTPWLVEQLIVDQAIGFLVGRWKVGKTWALLELAISIVTGRRAFGTFAVADPGPVVLVLEESGEQAFHRRLDRLVRGYALDRERLADLRYATNLGVRLNESRWQRRLTEAAKATQARAVILDPWVRVKGAATKENAQEEVGVVLDVLLRLRDTTGAAVLVSAHTGHEGRNIRGSSDLEAFWESRITLDRNRDTGETTLAAEHREADGIDEFRYQPIFDGTTRTVRLRGLGHPDEIAETQARNAEAARQQELRERILMVVDRVGDPTMTAITEQAGKRAADIRSEVEAMVAEGVLVEPLKLDDSSHTRRFSRALGTRPERRDGFGRVEGGARSQNPSGGQALSPVGGEPSGTGSQAKPSEMSGRDGNEWA